VAKVGHGAVGVRGDVAKAADMERVYDTVRHNGHLDVYSAAKAAVRSFARTWAYELRGRNIRVNALAPGATDTPAVDLAISTFAEKSPRGASGR
jgi:NAD(P)-dependent dehydrogenase (short-subunit alcohol dehydrogenase family)